MPIEEVLQVQPDVVEPPIPSAQEHVLAMDDLTDASEEEDVMPPLIDDMDNQILDVHNFLNLQGIPQFQVDQF